MGADSGTGLNAKDEVLLKSSYNLSLFLSDESENIMELLPFVFGANGNFPVVGDG